MFNLVWKDIVIQKKGLLILLPALCVYLALDTSYIWVGFIFSTVIIMEGFSKDEKSSINTLLNSLPYTRQEVVSSKYVSAIIFTLMIALTILIGNLLIHREMPALKDILFMGCLTIVFVSFFLPFSYKFKSQYIFSGGVVLFVVYMVVVNTFINNLNDILRELVRAILTFQDTSVYLMMACLIIVLYFLSWSLSVRIYKNKVF